MAFCDRCHEIIPGEVVEVLCWQGDRHWQCASCAKWTAAEAAEEREYEASCRRSHS